jgi:hypothetical protein|tara:strand:- start:1779 stop:1898 length:120 start_codon:yes stop_codon:yes gene_type:complete
MKIKIEIELDTVTDLEEKDALLDLLQEVKEHLMVEYEDD